MSARTALVAYRDDGPLAALLGRAARRRIRADPALLTLAGIAPVSLVAARPDGGPRPALGLGLGWLVMCAGASSGRPLDTRLSWLVPPALRAAEYGLLLRLAALAGERLEPAYAFLAVLAYHHYDLMYRIRSRGTPPPRWVGWAGGGWDLRLLLAFAALRAGRLRPALALGTIALGGIFLAESVRSWTTGAPGPVGQSGAGDGRDHPAALYRDDEADDE